VRKTLERSQLLKLARLFTLLRKTRVNNMILPEEKAAEGDVDVEERISEAGG
jgi:hypothetical protein